MKNLEHYLEKAIKNIEAKYVETLQRSNEQLVKISSLIEKKDSKQKGLSDIDKDEIFDMLQEGKSSNAE